MAVLQLEQIQFLNGYSSDCVILNESFLNPIKKYMDKIREIKNNRPEYPEDVQKFIDRYYHDIEKITKILYDEKKNIRKQSIPALLTGMVSIVAGMLLIESSTAIGAVTTIFGFITYAVSIVVLAIRMEKDKDAMVDLVRVKIALSKIDSTKLNNECRNKIKKCIHNIEDCEYFMDSIKTTIQ